MASTYLSRTTGTPTNAKKFTLSCWLKIGWTDSGDHQLFQEFADTSNREHFYFSQNQFRFYCISGGSDVCYLNTTRKWRDTNAWYHVVVACDSTQATSSDRVKMYVNGVQETAFDTATYPAQNTDFRINSASKSIVIGRYMGSNNYYYDGCVSHFHFIDGTQYAASDFGQTDATTGEWKIKTGPSVTYGDNGFFILKDGNSVTDQSGEGNNWTVTAGTLTKTEDNPSNVFATMNPLSPNDANGGFTNGNTSTNTGASAWRTMFSTIGNSTGKYYCEMKWVSGSNMMFGVFSLDERNKQKNVGYVGDGNLGNRAVGLAQGGDYYINGNNTNYTGGSNTSWTTGDIIQIALDKDNNKVYFGKNGTWMGSGDPTSGSTGTGAISFSTESHESWGFATSVYASTAACNFGNGYFGTSQVSSAGTNASNLGIFEYDVPAGYTALCTKGLNE